MVSWGLCRCREVRDSGPLPRDPSFNTGGKGVDQENWVIGYCLWTKQG